MARTKPLSARQRRARTYLALALLAMVGLVVALLIWQPWAAAEQGEPSSSGTPSETATSEPTPSLSTSTLTPTDPSASPDLSTTAACEPGSVVITPLTDKSEYTGDERVQLSFSIENTGSEPCSLNVGTSQQEYTITSGEDVVYRSIDCSSGGVDQLVALAPGVAQETVPITWDRTVSSAETCNGDRPAVPAGGATYNLALRVAGIDSAESKAFVLQ